MGVVWAWSSVIISPRLSPQSRMCKCSFDGNHFVPEDSLAKHERVCQFVAMGMDRQEAMVTMACT